MTASPLITIVSGLPRSGTSMMMKMLEAGGLPPLTDALRAADEDNPNGYYEFERVKKLREGDAAWLEQARGKAVKVIAALLPYLPAGQPCKIIFMRRAMPEIIASQRKMLARRGENPDKLPDPTLAALFEQNLAQLERWRASRPDIAVLDVDYNAMLADPAPVIAEICAFLGGSLSAPAMRAVLDPALYRQKAAR